MRRASRADGNQTQIVGKLRDLGVDVETIHREGRGIPDLLAGRAGINYLLEIKGPCGKLTPDQLNWHLTWHGQVAVVRTIEEALRVLGLEEASR